MDNLIEDNYFYNIVKLKIASSFYGNCEVCDKPADTMYYQDEYRKYTKPDGTVSRTQDGCRSLFGHESCLIQSRK